jgi:prepilin-type N-terminal cleavage/methylation domain-containing protein
MSAMRGTRGFSLIEVLIATAVSLAATLLACRLAAGAQLNWRVNGARADLQQRARSAADMLTRALLEAGGGPLAGDAYGPLLRHVPAVLPRRIGVRAADPFDAFRLDAFTTIHAVAETAHATLALPAPPGTPALELAAVAGCVDPSCGFSDGSTALVLDASGAYDLFTVTEVRGAVLTVRQWGPGSGRTHAAGSPVLSVESTSFFDDRATATLHRYDGDSSDVPALDDVVGFDVRYYGVVWPPLWPKPPMGQANCLYDAGGRYQAALMPALAGVAGLVEMDAGLLSDGPWCGSGGTLFDADLLRIRRVRVDIRLQASDPAVRGSDRARFLNAGTSRSEMSQVSDVTVSIDVAPRNLRQ